ncbi:MAG: glutamyl-tRNA reductase [Terrimesophilobacter sp.]
MLRCVSVNYRNAGFDFLERLSVNSDAVAEGLGAHPDVTGAIVLSTCNRFEVYVDSPLSEVLSVVASAAGVQESSLRDRASVFSDDTVAQHLFSVAAGLESVVVGEEEISGQVAKALSAARARGGTSSSLERLFQSAAKTSRSVKTGTALSVAGRSLARLALELTESRFADWAAVRVVLVGTGQYAATTVAALRERGAQQISVFSPTGRGAAFATGHGVRHSLDLSADLADADLVITCTVIESFVISAADLHGSRRRLIVDLGLPRNVNPDVATVEGVELLDLETISLHAPLEELTSVNDARQIVGVAASAFAAEQSVRPAVVALREHVLGILDAELHRRNASAETEAALRHFAGVLLHGPSVHARELAVEGRSEEFVAGIGALFGLQADTVTASAAIERDSA